MSKYKSSDLVDFLKTTNINASLLDKVKIQYRPYICPFDELLEEISTTDRVFDIGCGSGQFALLVAEFAKPLSISGIEIEEKLVKNAKQLLKSYNEQLEINFDLFDGLKIPNSIKNSTIVFMIDVLHHIPEDRQISFLKSLYTQMTPGTKLVLKDINKTHPLSPFNKLHDLVLSGEIGHELSMKKTNEILLNLGFKKIKQSKRLMLLYPHFTLIMEK